MKPGRSRILDERGTTLVEVMVTVAILTVALGITFSFLTTAQRTFGTQQERSDINSQARLGLQQLDRELRSGSVIRDPSTEAPANFVLRVLTQANNNQLCVQWRVADSRLERRQWEPSFGANPNPATVSGWRIVAESIVNEQVGTMPFRVDTATPGRIRTVAVVLVVDTDLSDTDSQPVQVEQSLTARNAVANFPQPPPGPYVGTSSEPCQPNP